MKLTPVLRSGESKTLTLMSSRESLQVSIAISNGLDEIYVGWFVQGSVIEGRPQLYLLGTSGAVVEIHPP